MPLVYWLWITNHPPGYLFWVGFDVGVFLFGGWMEAWAHEQI